MTDPNSEEERERIRKILEKTSLGQKVKNYSEKQDIEEKAREKELREHPREEKEVSIFDEPDERGLLTHPPNPLSDRHPHFKSLTVHQVEKIQQCCEEGLSIRSIKKAMHVFENADISFGTLQEIRKRMKEKEVSQSSSLSSSSS